MKAVLSFLLVFSLSGMIAAQTGNTGQGQKEKAAFVKEGKSLQAPANEKGSKTIKIHGDGIVKARKSKKREMMGSARTSGPAEKIKKMTVKQSVSPTDLRKIVDNPRQGKKRTPKN
jgi:hypothetical protein